MACHGWRARLGCEVFLPCLGLFPSCLLDSPGQILGVEGRRLRLGGSGNTSLTPHSSFLSAFLALFSKCLLSPYYLPVISQALRMQWLCPVWDQFTVFDHLLSPSTSEVLHLTGRWGWPFPEEEIRVKMVSFLYLQVTLSSMATGSCRVTYLYNSSLSSKYSRLLPLLTTRAAPWHGATSRSHTLALASC